MIPPSGVIFFLEGYVIYRSSATPPVALSVKNGAALWVKTSAAFSPER
jgi:hypothetical protein